MECHYRSEMQIFSSDGDYVSWNSWASLQDNRTKNRWFIGVSSEKLEPRPGAASSVQRVFTQYFKGSRCIQNSQPTISPTFASTPPNLKSPTLKHMGALPSQHPRDRWNMIGPCSPRRCLINLRAAAVTLIRPELKVTILFNR